ncbi:MAG TPA: GDP-mannose 4,6-dehydratase, partial [Fibrobacteraceae bacterium]|nr:GDP-mannose 4,6-dehydratase [Fibrobacteraceae bacterium]
DISRDVVDVRDVARGMIQVLNGSESGSVYNICCGKSYTFRELTEFLIDIAGVNVDFRFDPSLERTNDIPLLIGDPTKIMDIGWKPLISIEDSLTDLFNEMVIRRRLELKMQAEENTKKA